MWDVSKLTGLLLLCEAAVRRIKEEKVAVEPRRMTCEFCEIGGQVSCLVARPPRPLSAGVPTPAVSTGAAPVAEPTHVLAAPCTLICEPPATVPLPFAGLAPVKVPAAHVEMTKLAPPQDTIPDRTNGAHEEEDGTVVPPHTFGGNKRIRLTGADDFGDACGLAPFPPAPAALSTDVPVLPAPVVVSTGAPVAGPTHVLAPASPPTCETCASPDTTLPLGEDPIDALIYEYWFMDGFVDE